MTWRDDGNRRNSGYLYISPTVLYYDLSHRHVSIWVINRSKSAQMCKTGNQNTLLDFYEIKIKFVTNLITFFVLHNPKKGNCYKLSKNWKRLKRLGASKKLSFLDFLGLTENADFNPPLSAMFSPNVCFPRRWSSFTLKLEYSSTKHCAKPVNSCSDELVHHPRSNPSLSYSRPGHNNQPHILENNVLF